MISIWLGESDIQGLDLDYLGKLKKPGGGGARSTAYYRYYLGNVTKEASVLNGGAEKSEVGSWGRGGW